MSVFSDSYLAANAGNLPPEAIPMIRQRLESLTEPQKAYILSADLKSPTIALIFSIFLGGGNAFSTTLTCFTSFLGSGGLGFSLGFGGSGLGGS